MTVLFGAPATLVALAHLDATLRRALSPWVRSLEELVRKLLLAEAATHMPKAAPASWRPPIARRPAFLACGKNGSSIVTAVRASARFNLNIPRDERIVPDSRAPRIRALWGEIAPPAPSPAPRTKRTRTNRLALRFAALQRVIEKSESYARRLAARLAQIARDQRVRAAIRFACRGPDRIAPGFGDPLRDANTLIFARVRVLGDTS